jgi:putative two-component system response regulator
MFTREPGVYKILTVDDKADNLYTLERLLRSIERVEVDRATSGNQALLLTLEHDYCVAIVDVQMPEMDGYELVELLRGNHKTAQLPVIFVSAIYSDEYHHRKGYEVGAVDFMTKPFNPDVLLSKVRVFISLFDQRKQLEEWSQSLEGMVRQRTAELAHAYDSTLEGWARALELRERETAGHSRRVVDLTLQMARILGIPEDELMHIHRGALLHDIGKMGIPDSILLKPGELTQDEWEIMRHHPVYSFELLGNISFLKPALDIPYCHHERWDGSGYPRGLKGEQIPLAARIFAIVDVWDALMSDRPYRKANSKDSTLDHLRKESGKHFDPHLVEIFVDMINRVNP